MLKILHTNDIHSNYENFAKVVTLIKKYADSDTIILDAGDFADFKRLEVLGTRGCAANELLDYAGYDAMTVGNNETFNGKETLSYMSSKSTVPYLSANLYHEGLVEELEGLNRYVILEKVGKRFLIFGLSPNLNTFFELEGLEAKNYHRAIRDVLDQEEGSYDFCILLSHVGLVNDQEIAEKFDEIDIIIGGHSHDLMDEAEDVNGTLLHMSGHYGEHLGMMTIDINDDRLLLESAENISIKGVGADEGIVSLLKDNKERAIEYMSKPLYTIEEDLWHDVMEENPISNLLADALYDLIDCDVAFINSGVINGGIRKGVVNDKKLLEICPSPLNPTYFEIQGKYLREAFELSMEADTCMADGQGPGFRGKYVGKLHISNGYIEYVDRKLIQIYIGNEVLQEDRWYRVATSDYLHRGTGYQPLSNNRNVVYNLEFLRDTLRDYLCKPDFIIKSYRDRWIKLDK
ncbi:bifunctional metallophosphatase/5'-nucleotidase [Vallitalea okinawensis]|uniref:bifunctional metallophosphatase/5'-nucleotidase n=1 Tax=Vallitalea okinawensis TaxID=2078660 RepID=UPI001FA918E3|nr:metallophosphoesterase [Vallitalea okinawensis]